jgi:hypothetical protein
MKIVDHIYVYITLLLHVLAFVESHFQAYKEYIKKYYLRTVH